MSNSCDSDAEHGINVARAISDRQSMQKTGGLVERHADGVRYVGGRIAGMLGVLFVLVGMILTLQSPDRVLLIWAGLFLLVGIPAALIWLGRNSKMKRLRAEQLEAHRQQIAERDSVASDD